MRPPKDLRRRLREIRSRGEGEGPPEVRPQEIGGDAARTVAFTIDETIVRDSSDILAPEHLGLPELEPETLFWDLETTGLSYGAQIFLSGFLYREGSTLRLVQEVASDLAEERWLVESALRRIARCQTLVTYNGASFDLPVLRRRQRYHALPPLPETLEHEDLVYPTRRRYKKELPDCRLATLERLVLGRRRDQRDVPGAEAPIRFLDYVRSGDRKFIDPVIYHNRIDLTTLVSLRRMLAEEERLAQQRAAAEDPGA